MKQKAYELDRTRFVEIIMVMTFNERNIWELLTVGWSIDTQAQSVMRLGANTSCHIKLMVIVIYA